MIRPPPGTWSPRLAGLHTLLFQRPDRPGDSRLPPFCTRAALGVFSSDLFGTNTFREEGPVVRGPERQRNRGTHTRRQHFYRKAHQGVGNSGEPTKPLGRSPVRESADASVGMRPPSHPEQEMFSFPI